MSTNITKTFFNAVSHVRSLGANKTVPATQATTSKPASVQAAEALDKIEKEAAPKPPVAPKKPSAPNAFIKGLQRFAPYVIVGGTALGGLAIAAYVTAPMWTPYVVTGLAAAGSFLLGGPVGWAVLAGIGLLVAAVAAYSVYRIISTKMDKQSKTHHERLVYQRGVNDGVEQEKKAIRQLLPNKTEQPVVSTTPAVATK